MSTKHAQDEFLEETLQVLQPLSDLPLTQADSREAIENISGFFSLLMAWERAEHG